MNGALQWVNNLWNGFLVLCTEDAVFWISAILLGGVALLISFLRAQHRSGKF